MAKRYGRTPAEIAFPQGGLSVFEAQVFNLFIFGIAIERENKEAEKNRRAAERRRR